MSFVKLCYYKNLNNATNIDASNVAAKDFTAFKA